MTTPIEAAGYDDLRAYIQNNWPFVAILDDTGTEWLRWDVAANANAQWTSGPSTNPLTAELTVTGSDLQNAGATLPITLNRTEAYKTSSATTRMGTDTHTDATVQVSGDEVVITHRFRLPP